MKEPTKFMIHVKDGDISTTPSIDSVPRGGVLEWRCQDKHYHFALNLGYNSPCDKIKEQAGPDGEITLTVMTDASPGEYKYFIAVFKDGDLLTEDPRFIVRR